VSLSNRALVLAICLAATLVIGLALLMMIPANAHHGHHRNPGHPKLRKAVCLIVKLSDGKDGEAIRAQVPEFGCS
jgi:hypothetical protein